MKSTFVLKHGLALLLLSTLFAIGCGSGGDKDALTGEVKIDGSSTVYPITEAVAEEFRSVAPRVRVTVGVSGTGGGFQKFLRGETDINNASREIKSSEMKKAKEEGINYVRLSVAYDGLVVVINPKNDWAKELTVSELKKIWEPAAQGEITKWNQIRSEWPNEEIHLYGPGVASGTYDYFTEAIVGESGASRGDYTASEDDNVLVQGVATDKYALGFFGLAYYEENMNKLDLVAVDNGSGKAVKPSTKSVSNNTYKPLSRPLFIYVSEHGVQKESVRKFVDFYLEEAPALAKDVGYVAMPDSLYEVQKAKFDEFVKSVTDESHSMEKEEAAH